MKSKYENAQCQCAIIFAMAMLVTSICHFQIEGHVPTVAVLDTRAGSIILGRKFANKLARCQPPVLVLAGFFITATGVGEHGVEKTTLLLSLTLAKGTSKETNIKAPSLISNTDSYDVLPGMEFLGECFGHVDPLTKEFI